MKTLLPSPWPGRLSGWLDRLWAQGWLSRPVLEPEAIVDAASRRAARRPAAGAWLARLDTLCKSLDREARLNALGHTMAYGQLVKVVAARARAEHWIEKNPTISQRPLAAPLVVVGQMRSGTTRMLRLLACDPAFTVNSLYEQFDPVPYRGWRGWIDTRPISATLLQRGLALVDPALDAIHPTGATAAEEDFGLHGFSIWGSIFEGQWYIPTFARATERSDARDVYDEFALLLQLTAWARGEAPGRTPLLKAPQFAQDLDALIARFPGARLVVLDRPGEDVVASSASLAWHYARLQSDEVSAAEVGAEWLRKTRLRAKRLAASLERHPATSRVALGYGEVGRDWRGAVRQIYAMLGRRLEAPVELRMEKLMQRSAKRPQHRYSLEQFGLDPRQVAASLS